MEAKYYNRFFDLYKPIHNVVFTIDAELTESSTNCTIELKNSIQQILDETNEFDNISLDSIIDELKQILLTKTKENKEFYICDILEHWVEYAPYFDIDNERDNYWVNGRSVDANTYFYKIAKDIITKNKKTQSVRFNAPIFEKYIFCCYRKRNEFFDRLKVTCDRLGIDFHLLQEKAVVPSQTTEKNKNLEIKNLKSNHSPDQLGKIFVSLNKDKPRIDTNRKDDFVGLFKGDELKNWKRIKWTGTNPELATLVFKLTGIEPIPTIVNFYFDPKNKYDSNSHGGKKDNNGKNRNTNSAIIQIISKSIN